MSNSNRGIFTGWCQMRASELRQSADDLAKITFARGAHDSIATSQGGDAATTARVANLHREIAAWLEALPQELQNISEEHIASANGPDFDRTLPPDSEKWHVLRLRVVEDTLATILSTTPPQDFSQPHQRENSPHTVAHVKIAFVKKLLDLLQ